MQYIAVYTSTYYIVYIPTLLVSPILRSQNYRFIELMTNFFPNTVIICFALFAKTIAETNIKCLPFA